MKQQNNGNTEALKDYLKGIVNTYLKYELDNLNDEELT